MIRWLTLHRTQRVAVLRDGRFERLLGPGTHLVWDLSGVLELLHLDTAQVAIRATTPDPLPDHLEGCRLVTVGAHERVLVERDGLVTHTLGPGRYRIWASDREVALRRVDITAEPVALPADDRVTGAVGWVEKTASASHAVVLERDGQPIRELPRGRYRVWTGGPWSLEDLPRGLAPVELAIQDLVTGDQVPVRVKSAGTVRVRDACTVLTERRGHELVYAAIHLALRDVVSGKTFDELMADRGLLSDGLLEAARKRLPDVGLELVEAHVKDVILSAEVKALVNKVTFARKEAEALAITRREEVAATRQLANTAKLLEKSPVLLRLKELEAMGQVVQRVDKLVVVGGVGELARQVSLHELG